MPGLNIYLAILLLVASVTIGGLAFTTTVQVFRLRNKRMSWRAGTLKGFPLFSTLFLGISILLSAIMWFNGSLWSISAAGLYLFISVSWFVSSYFSSKRYVTDHGIVKNVNDPAQTVPWHQINDFFAQELDHTTAYIFIYRPEEHASQMVRLELNIPQKQVQPFKKLLKHKLGRRISCSEDSAVQYQSFN
jgi:hypothetical protein